MLSRSERGFTLIEVCIAIVILTVAILGLAASTGRLLGPTTDAEFDFLALQAVEDRLSEMRLDPRYADLDSLYEGTEASLPGLPGLTRTTTVTQTRTQLSSGRWLDYKTIVVTVSGGQLARPVSRTLVMGAP